MRFIYSKYSIVFVGALLLVFVLLILQVKGWLYPLEYAALQAPRPIVSIFKAVTTPIDTVIRTTVSIKKVIKENAELNSKVSDLQKKVAFMDRLESENQLLKKELGFVEKSASKLTACTVLSVDPQDLSDALVINCGEDQGIKVGQAVISDGYLVGKIIYSGKLVSTVLLATSPQSSIDAKISRNNIEGVVKGSFGSGMVLDLVSQNTDVKEGDLLITAGINDRIPPNILIGEIGQVISKDNDLFKKTSVLSPVQFKSTQYVFVSE